MDLAIIITILAAAVLLGGLAMLMIRRHDLHADERRELELRQAAAEREARARRSRPIGERAARIDPDFAGIRNALQDTAAPERKIRGDAPRPRADYARGQADGRTARGQIRATDDTAPALTDPPAPSDRWGRPWGEGGHGNNPAPTTGHHDAGPGPSWSGYSSGGYSSGSSDSGSSGGSSGGEAG